MSGAGHVHRDGGPGGPGGPVRPAALRVGILVLSDRASRGASEDTAGPALERWLAGCGVADVVREVLPDEREVIAARLSAWADDLGLQVILTCGGTGVAPRDVTPEATRAVIAMEIPGFGERMRAAGAESTPRAIIGRGLAGVRGTTLIVNLPGSPTAAVQSLAAVWPAVPHLVAKLGGDPTPCAGG